MSYFKKIYICFCKYLHFCFDLFTLLFPELEKLLLSFFWRNYHWKNPGFRFIQIHSNTKFVPDGFHWEWKRIHNSWEVRLSLFIF